MKIQVTETDIRNGRRNSGCFCPIAKAIKHHDGVVNAVVGDSYVHIFMKNPMADRRGIKLPDEAVSFIHRFDTGLPVAPFEFEI